MPSETLWLKIGKADIRVFKRKVGNALVVQSPELVQIVDGKPVREVRITKQTSWEQIGTGKKLIAETTLKDPETGQPVPITEARCILEHTSNLVLNEKSDKVDKKKIQYRILQADGSLSEDEIIPFPPTDRIEIEGKDKIPATVIDKFLIREEYELPAADPHNDAKLFEEAEALAKEDKIAITTYSNGGFTQYYAFLVPLFMDGKFVWVLKISDKQVEYNCLRDVPAPTTAFREVKTLQTLPPIQALLTVPRKK